MKCLVLVLHWSTNYDVKYEYRTRSQHQRSRPHHCRYVAGRADARTSHHARLSSIPIIIHEALLVGPHIPHHQAFYEIDADPNHMLYFAETGKKAYKDDEEETIG